MRNTLFFAAFLLMTSLALPAQESKVTEYFETIKTYPFSDPNPFPLSWNENVKKIYPYFRFDGFSYKGVPQKWKMVKMENDYIELYILPDMGGKLWGAIDKKTGKEFIYKNDVIKFRDVAQRGPWTSGGIEFNTGIIGHFPGGATPVDYKTFIDDGGTAHCVIGGVDLSSNVTWRVDISLAPDKSYFKTKTYWFNDSPFHQAYYYWSNAAVKAADDLHFYFPGDKWIDHDGSVHLWPVDKEGRDQSWYKNNRDNETSSYHVLGSIDNSFVSFYHDEHFGSGHWSPVWGTAGRKIWLWAQSDRGAIWEELLTDTHGQYVEVQAGRMFNQNIFECSHTPFKQTSFTPFNSDYWTERWFPVSDMNGVTHVSEMGTIFLNSDEKTTTLEFCPVVMICDTLTVKVGDKVIYHEKIEAEPDETIKKEYAAFDENSTVEVMLGSNELYSSERNYKLNRPVKVEGDKLTDEYIHAEQLLYHRDYDEALSMFLDYAGKQPDNLNALSHIAEIYYYRGENKKALSYCLRVLEINAYHPWANFIYANINKEEKRFADASDGYRFAMRSPEFRSPAFELLAEISFLKNDIANSIELAQKALDYDNYNLNAYKLLLTAFRKSDDKAEAMKYIGRMLDVDPLNHFALFEKYLLTKDEKDKEEFLKSFNNEMAREDYLNIAIFYTDMNLKDEAAEVLRYAPEQPVIMYWRAFINKDTDMLNDALAKDPLFSFPYRIKSLQAFDWAASVKPSWKTDYYRALILLNKGRKKEALVLMKKWDEKPDFSPFYYVRSYLEGQGSDLSLKDMEYALQIDPEQWRLYKEVSDIYNLRKEFQKSTEVVKKGYDRFRKNYVLGIAYAYSLNLQGEYEKSLKVLKGVNVLPFEGENRAQKIFFRDYLLLALDNFYKKNYRKVIQLIDASETYPSNFGSGSPTYPDYRGQEYLRGKAYEMMGQKEKADEIYEGIVNFYNPNKEYFGETAYARLANILALMKTGRHETAQKLADEWAREDAGFIGKWVKAVVENDKGLKEEVEKHVADGDISYDDMVVFRILKLYEGLKP